MGYQFKEQQLLRAALYHSSYANEHRTMGILSLIHISEPTRPY